MTCLACKCLPRRPAPLVHRCARLAASAPAAEPPDSSSGVVPGGVRVPADAGPTRFEEKASAAREQVSQRLSQGLTWFKQRYAGAKAEAAAALADFGEDFGDLGDFGDSVPSTKKKSRAAAAAPAAAPPLVADKPFEHVPTDGEGSSLVSEGASSSAGGGGGDYFGEWLNGQRHGRGVLYRHLDHSIYLGEWRQGAEHGYGAELAMVSSR